MQLRPAAEVIVGQLAPCPDEVVLDVGCGTGNAAMIAASRGARVTGVDPSPRLLEIARAVAAAARLDAVFALGDAASLPVPDDSVDAILSVFGVIFAPDAGAAAAEMARVLRPGRIMFSAWLREGALAEQARMRAGLVAEFRGQDLSRGLFAWHDPVALMESFGPHGFSVAIHDQALVFADASPEAYVDGSNLPITLAGLRRASCWSRSAGGRMSGPTSPNCSSTPTRIRVPSASPAATWSQP